MSTKVEFNSVGNAPLLVSFHQGVSDDNNEDIKISVLQKGDGKKRRRIVKGDTNEISYRSTDFGDDSLKHNCNSYAVGLVDEVTGALTVIPADHIFVMKPLVSNNSAVEGSVHSSKDSHFARKQELAEAFGSSKKQRAILAAQSNIISVDNIAGANSVETAMTSAAATARMEASSSSNSSADNAEAFMNAASDALETNRALLLPPYNQAEGLTVEELYPMEGLVPSKVQTALEFYYKEQLCPALEGEGAEEGEKDQTVNLASSHVWVDALKAMDISSLTLSSILSNAGAVLKSKHQRKQLIARCVYLQFLITFYSMLAGNRDRVVTKDDFKKRVEKEGMDSKVVAHIADSFSTFRRYKGSPAFTATKALLDKLIFHIVILGLSLNSFVLDLAALTTDLKNTTSSIVSNLAREAGCRISKDGAAVRAELSAPLVFPKMKIGSTKK